MTTGMLRLDEELPAFTASPNGGESPPQYERAPARRRTARRATTEHVYGLGDDKKLPWAFLKIYSRAKRDTKLPLFLRGDSITGSVELNLEKGENIQAVVLQVRGEYWSSLSWIPELEANVPFWSHETTLWPLSTGEPGPASSIIGNSKLKGKHVWPFSITLPKRVIPADIAEESPGEFDLPPNFKDHNCPVSLDYRISVIFSRGRLRLNDRISTPFVYRITTHPKAPSILRQLAYMERWPPVGPQGDPEGWEIIKSSSISGMLFGSRLIEVRYSVALAKPLCYTRGTFIPFTVTISCPDSQALDLLTRRSSLAVELTRTLDVKVRSKDKTNGAEQAISKRVGTGVHWLSHENGPTLETRKIDGEISVKSNLKPSFVFPQLSIKYHVSFVLTAPGFTVDGGALTLTQQVRIVSEPAPGPPPRSRAREQNVTLS